MTSSSYANLLSTSPFHKVAHKLPSYSLPLQALCLRRSTRPFSNKTSAVPKAAIATELYTSYICPYAQRVWIARNSKEKIKLVPIDLEDRPSWYKEKVYPPNKVPSLEHDNEVRGESLDLMKYIDSSFEGPALYPNDPAMREFAEELLSYSDTFNRAVLFSLKGESLNEISLAVNYLETALSKFSDGPFFLGQFSLVDIAYAPFVERFHPLLLEVKNYDITTGRPTLRSWIENVNKIEAYKQTKRDPQELVAVLKKRFSIK
ncbi:glutathione S-transferase L3-like isoform X4 [Rhododendron vialii]|uniref:glutathione S-transferase L3-like isoform X4 n=1 Tax=Rhododendron vialii TaxID=182163 RepID=UPI00265E6890|nr:glutathione S-transferase L3-like isoform X4 [Rhododendron vialii]